MINLLLLAPFIFAGLLNLPSQNKHKIAIVYSGLLMIIAGINYYVSCFSIQTTDVSSQYFLTFASDKLSSLFALLTTFLLFITFFCGYKTIEKHIERYYISFFVLTGLIIGFFLTTDIITFYVCFELSLIPMFLLISTFGSEKRMQAAFKLLLYTVFGSLFFLVSMIYIVLQADSTQISVIVATIPTFPIEIQQCLWIGIMIAFLIKIPVIPLHSWLPAAHVEAPMGGSVFLAGIIIKMGGYGILKIVLPAFPEVNLQYQNYMFIIGLVAIIYASLLVLKQTDIKKIIAYSSIAHMGYVVIALFCLNKNGVYAAILQMISHGFISGGLFICIGLIYHQTHTREIGYYGDLATSMPKFATLFSILTFANIGLPLTSGFVGEFVSIIAASQVNFVVSGIMCFGVVLSALYMLKLLKKLLFSSYGGAVVLYDINIFGVVGLAIICGFVIIFGVLPELLLDSSEVAEIINTLYIKI